MLHVDNFWNTTQPGWLNNYVVDDAAGDQKVGGEDEGEDGPGGGGLKKAEWRAFRRCEENTHMKPCWLFDFQIRYSEDRKYGA